MLYFKFIILVKFFIHIFYIFSEDCEMGISKIRFINLKKLKNLITQGLVFSSLLCFSMTSKEAYSADARMAATVDGNVARYSYHIVTHAFIAYTGAHMLYDWNNNQPNPNMNVADTKSGINFFYSFKDTGDQGINAAKHVFRLRLNEHKMVREFHRGSHSFTLYKNIIKEWFHVVTNFQGGGDYLFSDEFPLFPVAKDKNGWMDFANDYLKMMHYVLNEGAKDAKTGDNVVFQLARYHDKEFSEIYNPDYKEYKNLLLKDESSLDVGQRQTKNLLEDLFDNMEFHAVLSPNSSLDPVRHSTFSRNDFCLRTMDSENALKVQLTKDRLMRHLGCKLYTFDIKLNFSQFISALKGEFNIDENGQPTADEL